MGWKIIEMKDSKLIFEGQILHLFILAILIGAIFSITGMWDFFEGQYLGISTAIWFYLSIATPIMHQVYVWFCWRTQFHFSLITRVFGEIGFTYYGIVFFILFFLRFIFVTILSISNKGSVDADPSLLYALAVIITLPALYLFYSVKRYFGIKRALGADHFDGSYRNSPLVTKGIHRFVNNGMYIFGVAIIWVPGLVFASRAALLAAMFQHIYIWVHYYATEKPDMKRIYGLA
ncbi:MAG: methyltransferase [Methanosarcinaceae archaeon]|nr:methyltransferase [Methanosarcinaceae archaeon]